MPTTESSHLLTGVIEGFYGQPWAESERLELFRWMAKWGLNTYLYAPKDDLHQRAFWRERYTNRDSEQLGRLIKRCLKLGLRFVYALSPGLDISYNSTADLRCIRERFEQLSALGCKDFAILFDDIPERIKKADLKRFGSLGSAQCHVANAIFKSAREQGSRGRFFFCPTAYCGRMAAEHPEGHRYLQTVGRELLTGIDVFWTGPEIVSQEINVAHIHELQASLRRKPVIWDNLHANDYDRRRFYSGPYSGRPMELKKAVAGLLSNPNNEFLLNFVPLRSLAEFVGRDRQWDPLRSYLNSMREWLPEFAANGREPLNLEDLILFMDCFYLPHQEGQKAEELYCEAKRFVEGTPVERFRLAPLVRKRAERLRRICGRFSELRQRPLFYALSRASQELGHELDLLLQFIQFETDRKKHDAAFRPGTHLSGTYRGGVLSRLQQLLVQRPDGSFMVSDRTQKRASARKSAHRFSVFSL
jgi:protein O-GlcNAcase/histone acetyltransferase